MTIEQLPDDAPITDFDPENPDDSLKKLVVAMSDKSLVQNQDRPYAGQSHTVTGRRGQTLVEGMTLRDVYDCIIMGMVAATPFESLEDCDNPYRKMRDGQLEVDDVYKCNLGEADPIAIAQNACVALRFRMEGKEYPDDE